MKTTLLALAAAAAALGCPTVEAAGKKPFIQTGGPCGTPEDFHLCLTVRANRDYYLNAAAFKFPAPGTVEVKWLGTAFCDIKDMDGGSASNSIMEYFVHFNLSEGQGFGAYNEPGTASIGERLNVKATTTDVLVGRTMLTQVTLSRTFPVARKGSMTFRTFAYGDFRVVGPGSFCNINGGAFTVNYVPE